MTFRALSIDEENSDYCIRGAVGVGRAEQCRVKGLLSVPANYQERDHKVKVQDLVLLPQRLWLPGCPQGAT